MTEVVVTDEFKTWKAVLLLGGDKTGNERFYDEWVPRAGMIWERYLTERGLEREK